MKGPPSLKKRHLKHAFLCFPRRYIECCISNNIAIIISLYGIWVSLCLRFFTRHHNFPSGPKYEQLISEVITQLELLTICYWWTRFLVNKAREKLTQEHYWQIWRRCKRFNPGWFREPSPKATKYKYNCSEPPVYLKSTIQCRISILTKIYCITISIQKIMSIHPFSLEIQQILEPWDL